MIIFKILYYLYSIPVLIHEHDKLISGKSGSTQLKSEMEMLKSLKRGNMSAIEKSIAKSIIMKFIFQASYYLWLIIGLSSSNWCTFLVILVMSQIPKKSSVAIRIDAILTILLVIFIILNTVIYKIDLFSQIKNWLDIF